jgi:hypothetical protein
MVSMRTDDHGFTTSAPGVLQVGRGKGFQHDASCMLTPKSEEAIPLLAIAVGALALIILSRVPIAPSALSYDNVNFAFALQQFDPWMHQPQPPGYPFFVIEARLVNLFFDDAEKTFLFISVVITWLSIVMAFLFGKRMFGTAGGYIGALLLALNPTLWYTSLDSPLRPHLALFSIVIAYFCWRMWNGESRLAPVAAALLGIGSGFRPDLVVYLFPLWCVTLWKTGVSWHIWVRGIGIIFGLTMVWIAMAAYAVGGLDRYTLLMWVYSFASINQGSVLLRPSSWDWVYQIVRMFAWNGFGVLSWVWLLPIWLFRRRRAVSPPQSAAFIAAWIVPGMVVQALLHVDAPGHTLFSVPALCLVGAGMIRTAGVAFAAPALVLNVLFFFNIVTIKFSPPVFLGEFGKVVTQAFVGGISYTTFGDLQSNNQLSESSVRDLKRLLADKRPVVIVSTLGSAQYWRFLSARVASYYLADQELWVVGDEETPPSASRIHGKDLIEIRHGASVKIPIPRGGRIIWLMDPASPFREAVSRAVSLNREGHVFHSDLAADVAQFRVDEFEFIVEE